MRQLLMTYLVMKVRRSDKKELSSFERTFLVSFPDRVSEDYDSLCQGKGFYYEWTGLTLAYRVKSCVADEIFADLCAEEAYLDCVLLSYENAPPDVTEDLYHIKVSALP